MISEHQNDANSLKELLSLVDSLSCEDLKQSHQKVKHGPLMRRDSQYQYSSDSLNDLNLNERSCVVVVPKIASKQSKDLNWKANISARYIHFESKLKSEIEK